LRDSRRDACDGAPQKRVAEKPASLIGDILLVASWFSLTCAGASFFYGSPCVLRPDIFVDDISLLFDAAVDTLAKLFCADLPFAHRLVEAAKAIMHFGL